MAQRVVKFVIILKIIVVYCCIVLFKVEIRTNNWNILSFLCDYLYVIFSRFTIHVEIKIKDVKKTIKLWSSYTTKFKQLL